MVIQNVGAYLDVPRFLDSDHPIETAADAEAYLARLESYPKHSTASSGASRRRAAQGLVPPAFLIDKALTQMALSAKNAREGGSLVESIERRTKPRTLPATGRPAHGDRGTAGRAGTRSPDRRARAQRAVATDDAGMWARPHGDDFYRWALKASTTTTMSPDEVHEMGPTS